MTRHETAETLAILKAAYPHSFREITKADAEAMLNLWARQFAEDDPKIVSAAIDSLIATRTSGYSPTIGEVKEQIAKLNSADIPDDGTAWAYVSRACRNGLYGYREEFAKLPLSVQRAVGAPEQLKQWAAMDAETVESVIASNFRKTYNALQIRERERAKLPISVRQMITGIADHMRLEG